MIDSSPGQCSDGAVYAAASRAHHEDSAVAMVDAVLEMPSAQIQLNVAGVCCAPEGAARWNALHCGRNLPQNFQGLQSQLGRYVDIRCKVNRVRHAKYFALSGPRRNTTGSVVFAFARDLIETSVARVRCATYPPETITGTGFGACFQLNARAPRGESALRRRENPPRL